VVFADNTTPSSEKCVKGRGCAWTYGLGFETLDQDAVEEGNEGFNRLEGSLGGLYGISRQHGPIKTDTLHTMRIRKAKREERKKQTRREI